MAENCKIYTPKEYVEEVLNAAGYVNDLFGKSVLENSCGVGNILCGITERYIVSSRQTGISLNEIKSGLERDICGTEIDPVSVNECKRKLSLVAEVYNIRDVDWQIFECDYLKHDLGRTFDYIIGNPPYIVYRDIANEDLKYIRDTFPTCKKWKFNYYYAFIEKSVKDLSQDGKMAYIVPYSLYKNVGASLVRDLIKPYLTNIIDYTHSQKFPGIVTSSTILVLQKNPSDAFVYEDVNDRCRYLIQKNQLSSKWLFTDVPNKGGPFVFGEYFKICNAIATLCNEAFILENYEKIDGYYQVGDSFIEEGIVKPAISRKRGRQALDIAIIFPYYYEDGKLRRYTEQEARSKFPQAFSYLNRFREKLDNRASDKVAKWFEYGRSQALSSVLSYKLVLPSIESKKIEATIVSEDTIPIAGFFVTAKGNQHSIEEAKRILESDSFYSYLCTCGIFTTGHSRRISVKDIAAYKFNEWVD